MSLSSMAVSSSLSLAAPLFDPKYDNWAKKKRGCNPVRVSMPFRPYDGSVKLARVTPLRLGSQRLVISNNRMAFSPVIRASAARARCSSSQGQTQTVTREAPTITQAPVHGKEKSPDLDDGGTGFPPGDDGGGGGGGGGGGNWSGGFFLFGFLAFLGLLKDKESEEDYRGSRRR